MNALIPFYNRIYVKLDSDCTDKVYEFIYKTSIKNNQTTIVLDKFNQKFIDEVSLFKNINFQINVTNTDEIIDNDSCFYFCKDTLFNSINYKNLGVYHNFDEEYCTNKEITQYNIDETIVRNSLESIINNLTYTSELDMYQNMLLATIKPLINTSNTVIDLYLLKNRNSLFLDSQGNFYSDITYKEMLGNIITDNIELSLFRYIERGIN